MKTLTSMVVAVVVGVAVTLATGLVNVTPAGLVGAVWYGLPLAWLYKLVIAPQYFPWRVDGGKLIFDLAFWFALVGLIVALARGSGKDRRRR